MPDFSFPVVIFWIAAASCLVAQVAIIRGTILARASATPAPDAPAITRSSFPLELLWAVLPALALAAVLWFTWQRIAHANGAALDPHAHAVALLQSPGGQSPSATRAPANELAGR